MVLDSKKIKDCKTCKYRKRFSPTDIYCAFYLITRKRKRANDKYCEEYEYQEKMTPEPIQISFRKDERPVEKREKNELDEFLKRKERYFEKEIK